MAAIMVLKFCIRFLAFTLLFAFSALPPSHGKETRKTHNMIYYDINHFAPCVRRFNATHQIGCTSEFNGNNGVIHLIEKKSDLDWLLKNGTYEPYIALMTLPMFKMEYVRPLLDSGKINGIMVDQSNQTTIVEEVDQFSPDKSCPNDNYGMYSGDAEYANCKQVEWNKGGNAMSFMDFKIPVFSLTKSEEVKFIKECYETHNRPDAQLKARPFPQCAGEMYVFMFGAKDTPTCVRRTKMMTNLEPSQYCDALGDSNIWATLLPTNKSTPVAENSIIIAAAQLDATDLFYQASPSNGAENTISGFVTMLAAAEAIGSLPQSVKERMKNIMFTFFQGESYDYIGSSRMVYDMKQGKFPMKLEDKLQQPSQINLTSIAAFLEVRQLAMSDQANFYAHIDPLSQSDGPTQQGTNRLLQLLKQSAVNITMNNVSNEQPLPPASFQQFLRNGTNIPGVVITDHNAEYQNKFYNSRLDQPAVAYGVNYSEYNSTDDLPIFPVAETLTDVATTIARALYQFALPGATDADTLVADVELVNDLLYCFNERPNCSRIREVTQPENAKALSNYSYDLYVSVYGHNSPVTYLVGQLLAAYLGQSTPMTQEESKEKCKAEDNDKIFSYSFVLGKNYTDSNGLCWKSTKQNSMAVSPAFDEENPDWGSTIYSTWTESQWSTYYVRAFLKPSRSQETVTFSVGMIIILISITGTYFLSKKSDDLFP